MAKSNLLQAVCAAAVLAVPLIAPGMAQSQRPEAGMTSANGTPNPEAKQPNTGSPAPSSKSTASATMAPASNDGTTTDETKPAHHHMMSRPVHAMRSRTDTSQDGAVDRLNDQSLHAAEKGQMFSAADTPTGMNSSSMNKGGIPPSGAMTNPTK